VHLVHESVTSGETAGNFHVTLSGAPEGHRMQTASASGGHSTEQQS